MSPSPESPLFAPPVQQRTSSLRIAWQVAAAATLLLIVGTLLFPARHKAAAGAGAILPPDPKAAVLVFSDLQMSESTSLSGGKSTFIDGHVKNVGPDTVKDAALQVLFGNDEQLPPQLESVSLTLIRTHDPYIDTQPLSSAPLAPGDQREFRLIFENIATNWNQQMPVMHVVRVVTNLR